MPETSSTRPGTRSGGDDTAPRHPIGVVSARTGLPQDVLRAWERRYGAVVPHRTDTGRRLYTDRDLEVLRLLKHAVDAGRRISDVAPLELEALRSLVREDRAEHVGPVVDAGTRASEGDAAALYAECLTAVETMDAGRLADTLRRASVQLSRMALHTRVIAPLVHEIGEKWTTGDLRPKNEHLATSVVRSFLGEQLGTALIGPDGPRIVVTTPAGQRHELGALLVAILAEECGWMAVYLGADLPAEEIAAAAVDVGARAVGLSLVFPRGEAGTSQELRRLRTLLGPDVALIAGGQGAGSYDPVLREIGAQRTGDLARFREILADLVL